MQFPVSIKGVVFKDERAILLRNERDEWELPGGKLEPDEEPELCCAREIREELALAISHEHKEVGLFRVPELDSLPMPEGYRASVRRWWGERYTG